jgi:hypothetical protein
MHDNRTVITLDPSELEQFRYIVREEVSLGCRHIADSEDAGKSDDDGGCARLERLALSLAWPRS